MISRMKLDFSYFDTVLFDLDGTLVLTEHVWQAAKHALAAKYGVSATSSVLDAHVGRRAVDFVSAQLPELAEHPDHLASAIQQISTYALARLADQMTVVPGAGELVRNLHDAGKRLAICSSAPLPAIHIALEVMAVRDCFSCIVSAADMPVGKPDPAPYLKTLDLLQVPAQKAMAIEDSLIGVTSATRAGLFTVAVGGDATVVESGLADLAFAHLKEIPLIEISTVKG